MTRRTLVIDTDTFLRHNPGETMPFTAKYRETMPFTAKYRGFLQDVERSFPTREAAQQWLAQVGKSSEGTITETVPSGDFSGLERRIAANPGLAAPYGPTTGRTPATVPARIRFNTGRMYAEKGQRIAAQLSDDNGILFTDVDRGIDGFIPADVVRGYSLSLTEVDVMEAYDGQLCDYWADAYKYEEQLVTLRAWAREL